MVYPIAPPPPDYLDEESVQEIMKKIWENTKIGISLRETYSSDPNFRMQSLDQTEEKQGLLTIPNSLKNADDEFYRRVLTRQRTSLISDIDSETLLDVMLEQELISYIQYRDIQKQRVTFEKNRKILQLVYERGGSFYQNLKKCLRKAHQTHLVDLLEREEKRLEEEERKMAHVSPAPDLESHTWDDCLTLIEKKDLAGAKRIVDEWVNSNHLPSQRHLNRLQRDKDSRDSVLPVICNAICNTIKQSSNNIEDVCPSYEFGNPDSVVFVIEVTPGSENTMDLSYDHVTNPTNVYSDEGHEVFRRSNACEKLSLQESEEISSVINKLAGTLSKNHRNLSIIDVSPVRSKEFRTEKKQHKLVRETCLALYVRRKHYIPLGEEPFQSHYEGVPVDVREGVFIPQGRLKLGCQILSDKPNSLTGTLGGFIDHPQFGLCGLTCAHVLLDSQKMNILKENGGCMSWPYFIIHDTVLFKYNEHTQRIGRLVKAFLDEGSSTVPGMEVAIFQIEEASPEVGDFIGTNVLTCQNQETERKKKLTISLKSRKMKEDATKE